MLCDVTRDSRLPYMWQKLTTSDILIYYTPNIVLNSTNAMANSSGSSSSGSSSSSTFPFQFDQERAILVPWVAIDTSCIQVPYIYIYILYIVYYMLYTIIICYMLYISHCIYMHRVYTYMHLCIPLGSYMFIYIYPYIHAYIYL